MSTLFVSDLDGTLLNSDRQVSSRSATLINEAIADGALFSVATARTPATVSVLLKDIDSSLPLIVMTGAAIWDRKENRYLHAAFHQESAVRRLVETYRRHSLSAFIYILGEDNIIHIYHIGPMSGLEREFVEERLDNPFKRFHIPESGDSHLPERLDRVLLFYCMRPTQEVEPVYEEIRDQSDIRPVYYHDMYGEDIALMEVFGPGASKAAAVRKLTEMMGIDRIVAYGDNVNDLPILEIADDAVAVENAVAEVKAIATRIIGSNEEDSVAMDIKKHTKMH